MLSAFMSAIAQAIEVLFDKVIVGEKGMSGLVLFKIQVTFVALIMIIPMMLGGSLLPDFFEFNYLLLFTVLIIVGVTRNILYFTALGNKKMSEIEPVVLMSTPLTVFLAMIMLPDERNFALLLIAIVATLALMFSRLEKKHLDFDKYSWILMGANLLIAVEVIIVKNMLTVMNAVTLYGIRTAMMAIVLFVLFRNIKIINLSKKEYFQTFTTGIIACIEYVTKFISIGVIGVVNSALVILLAPILILVFSMIFLKEKVTLKRGIGDVVIILCIIAIVLIG